MGNSIPSGTRDFEIRRIFLPDEANQIRELQRNAPEFYRHYPKHDQWLDMAIEQILDGSRIAFGVYKLTFDSRHRAMVKLVGSIILKKKLYADIMEMKNLFIGPEYRGIGYGTALYKAVEEYCAKSGYSLIETEVPCSETNTVGFLHKMGLRVTEMRQSPYKSEEYVYTMKKTLFPFYGGDIFDLYEIALWLISNYYAFANVRASEKEKRIVFDLVTKASLARVYENRLAVRGLALVIEDNTDTAVRQLLNLSETLEYNLILVFGRGLGKRIQEMCTKQRIMLIDEKTIYRSFGHLFAYRPPSFLKGEVAGMIVAMNPEYFSRIADTQISFSYFKGGPAGKYLKEGDKLLILSEPTPRHPMGGIKGFGEVAEVMCGPPEQVWNRFGDRNPLFNQNEYYTFTKNKRNVLGVLVHNFRQTPTVDYARLESDVIGEPLDIMDLGHCYISHQMLAGFVDLTETVSQSASETEVEVLKQDTESRIRILFLAANPSNTTRLRLDAEIRSIDQALREAQFRDRFDIRQHWAVRVADIQSYLLRHQPHIVHFSGHGSPLSGIILEDDQGKSHPVSVRALSQLFSVLKDNIRCVVLNACYSEQQAEAIAQHIDCVIGMSNAVGDTSAMSFSKAFYQALGYGKDVRTAFELGCVQIDLENLAQQDTPQLLATEVDPNEILFVEG